MVEVDHENKAQGGAVTGRIPLLLVLVLALIGVGVSIELSRIHYFTHTDPVYKSVCAVNETVNCETVARSPYSVFFGAPVSAWGIFGYVLIAAFAVWGLNRRRLHPLWPFGVLTGLIGAALVASSFLAYISFTRIDSVCLFCTTLYLINLILLGTIIGWAIRQRLNPIKAIGADARAVFSKPLIVLSLLVLVGGSATAVATAIPPYWYHARWHDLPKLPTGVDEQGHHWIGAKKPLITIVEFSDYECPFCRRAHKETRLLAGKYPDAVRLVHRHLPLDKACNKDIKRQFHKRACEFSKAAECAGNQHAFWDMNDALFSVQDSVHTEDVDLEALAVELGLDRSQFKACMAADGTPKQVLKDIEASRKLDIKGTPTYFIGPREFPGGIPDIVIENAVKRAREKK